MLKSWFGSLRRVQRELNVLFSVSVAVFLALHRWGGQIPIALGFGIVELLQQVSLAFIGGFVFWFVADHWNDTKDRNQLKPRVSDRVLRILVYYNNALVALVSAKAVTSFSHKTIRSITRQEWPVFINELYWLRAIREHTESFYFEDLYEHWIFYAEEASTYANQVVSLFDGYDPELTALLDAISSNDSRMRYLENSKRNFQRHRNAVLDQPKELPPMDNLVFHQCFAIHEAIQRGIQLVDYADTLDEPTMTSVVTGCKKLLDTKGEYKADDL